MRKLFPSFVVALLAVAAFVPAARGEASEEAAGKTIWENLQAKRSSCTVLAENDFELLGEYFMGQMAGTAHEGMNQMMKTMMGEEGERATHIALGKRASGCDPNAAYPMGSGMMGWGMPMMGGYPYNGASSTGWIRGGWSNPFDLNLYRPMMPMIGFGYGYGAWSWVGFILMLAFWIVIILALAAGLKWLIQRGSGSERAKSALGILEERYAKGEISKKEFEEKKKDLLG